MTGSGKLRPLSARYERPVPAKLVVRLENGEEWEATAEDLARFGAGVRLDLYGRLCDLLAEGLGLEPGTDLTRDEAHEGANLVRYLAECALMYDHSPWADERGEPWPEDDADEREDFRARLRGYLLTRPPRLELRVPDGEWRPFREFVTRCHVPANVEWRLVGDEEDPRFFPVLALEPDRGTVELEAGRRVRLVVTRDGAPKLDWPPRPLVPHTYTPADINQGWDLPCCDRPREDPVHDEDLVTDRREDEDGERS